MRAFFMLTAFALAPVVVVHGQAPTQSAAAPSIATLPAAIPVGSRVGELLSGYDDGGRRDPFGSLVTPRRTSTATSENGRPRTGLAGLALADVEVRGIVRSGDTRLAILQGPNNQSYVSRVKDRLADATIVSIDRDGVVFSEQLEGSRAISQIRKALRPAGEDVR